MERKMSDLNKVIQNALGEIDFQEIAKQAAIEEVKKAVKKAVENQFGWSGSVNKALDEHLKKELMIDFSNVKLPEYRSFIIGEVNKSLVSFIGEDHAKEIVKHVNEKVVGESRDTIDYEEFWSELCEKIENECDKDDNEKYFVEFNNKDDSYFGRDKYHQLIISEKKDSYSSSSSKQSEVMYFAFSDGVIYHHRTNDDFELSSIATWLKALQFRKTKILNIDGSKSSTIPDRY